MKTVYTYSHLGGEEILLVRYPEINKEIEQVIRDIPNLGRGKVSEEKTMKGEKLYSPKDLNDAFEDRFTDRGWEELKDYYTIEIPNYRHKVKNSYKQCDYHKGDILIEVQFGKYAFMFYDLAKFQYFYNQGKIEVGVEIVPSHFLYRQMSSGVSYGEQLVNDLERLKKNFPSVPVKIILLDMPIENTDYMINERKKVHEDYEKQMKQLEEKLENFDITLGN